MGWLDDIAEIGEKLRQSFACAACKPEGGPPVLPDNAAGFVQEGAVLAVRTGEDGQPHKVELGPGDPVMKSDVLEPVPGDLQNPGPMAQIQLIDNSRLSYGDGHAPLDMAELEIGKPVDPAELGSPADRAAALGINTGASLDTALAADRSSTPVAVLGIRG